MPNTRKWMAGGIRGRAVAAAAAALGLLAFAPAALAHPTTGLFPPGEPNPAPSVSGDTVDGSTLTGDNGGWAGEGGPFSPSFEYSWLRCEANGTGCAVVGNQTDKTYLLEGGQDGDVGKRLKFRVVASSSGGTHQEDSQMTDVIQAVPPANTSAPSVSGTPRLGLVLTGTDGTWTGTQPIAFARQWQRCDSAGANCTDIGGATGSSYALTRADVGATVRFEVTADNAATGDATATSAATARVEGEPENTSLPTVGGTAEKGETLAATDGSWSAHPAAAFTYQWLRCDSAGGGCANIAGATAADHTLGSADVGKRLKVRVRGSNSLGSATADSALTDVVTAAPENTALPTISGTAVRDETLTASSGTWTGTAPIAFAHQWRRCEANGTGCADILGATAANYKLAAADVGKRLEVRVAATNGVGSSTADSALTDVVTARPENTAAPTVTGNEAVGETLTGTDGTWTGTPPPTFDRQWFQCNSGGSACSAIAGATSLTYVLRSADAGRTLKLRVTADNAAPGTAVATSALTGVIEGPPSASFSFSPASPQTGQRVSFTASGSDPDGGTLVFDWDLDGDGAFDDATGTGASRTFTSAGTRTVRLRVTDDEANASVASRSVRVVSPPAPAAPVTPPSFDIPDRVTPTPTTPSEPAQPAFIRPFPVVRIAGRSTRRGARIRLLAVRAPRGSLVRVRCKGGKRRGCKYRRARKRVGRSGRVRIKGLQRRLRAGAVIEISVTRPGEIGKFTRFRIRRRKAPLRRDLCVAPGSRKPTKCEGL